MNVELPKIITKKKLRELCSLYIRMRDTDKRWRWNCITCDKRLPRNEWDAGHFISRAHNATFVEPQNINLQCKYCNWPRAGMQYEHGKAIDRKYWEWTADKLVDMKKQTTKFGMTRIKSEYDAYLVLLLELVNKKYKPVSTAVLANMLKKSLIQNPK